MAELPPIVLGPEDSVRVQGSNVPTTPPTPLAHTHPIEQVIDLQPTLDAKANKDEVDSALAGLGQAIADLQLGLSGKAPTTHDHTIAQVEGLATELQVGKDLPLPSGGGTAPAQAALPDFIRGAIAAERVKRWDGRDATISVPIVARYTEHVSTLHGFNGGDAVLTSTVAAGLPAMTFEVDPAATGLNLQRFRLGNFQLNCSPEQAVAILVRIVKGKGSGYQGKIHDLVLEGGGLELSGWMFENNLSDILVQNAPRHAIAFTRDMPTNSGSFHTQTRLVRPTVRYSGTWNPTTKLTDGFGTWVQEWTHGIEIKEGLYITCFGPAIVALNGIRLIEGTTVENACQGQSINNTNPDTWDTRACAVNVSNYATIKGCDFGGVIGCQKTGIVVDHLIGNVHIEDCGIGSATTTLVHVKGYDGSSPGKLILKGKSKNLPYIVPPAFESAGRVVRVD